MRKAINVREATLPGVGVKYVMSLEAGGNVAVIVKPDEDRHIYHFREDEDRPCDVVKFNPDEAQQLANLMGRPMVNVPAMEQLQLALGALELEWVTLDKGSDWVGQTLDALLLRTQTGASLIAILRGETAIPNPSPDTLFEMGDTLLIIGSHEQVGAAQTLLEADH